MGKPLCIYCEADELDQGLFGQVFYYLMQVLPYLHTEGIYPQWAVRTKHYADAPDFLTIPGVLDLAYTPPAGPYRMLTLNEMRRRHAHILGNDWHALKRLWDLYFRVPERVTQASCNVLPQGKVLGVHYRGTDKQLNSWDSNPISRADFLTLLQELLDGRPEFTSIFAATDEFAFVRELEQITSLPVLSLGEVEFHMASEHSTTRAEKADRAMLDCVLLSLCSCVLETSSALPSFAKLLNPDLEIFRTAASKLFGKLYTDMPYFPVAQIPIFPAARPESQAILKATMADDWTVRPETQQYMRPFTAVPRWKRNHRVFTSTERLGLDRVAGLLLRDHA